MRRSWQGKLCDNRQLPCSVMLDAVGSCTDFANYESGGRTFKSCRAHHFFKQLGQQRSGRRTIRIRSAEPRDSAWLFSVTHRVSLATEAETVVGCGSAECHKTHASRKSFHDRNGDHHWWPDRVSASGSVILKLSLPAAWRFGFQFDAIRIAAGRQLQSERQLVTTLHVVVEYVDPCGL